MDNYAIMAREAAKRFCTYDMAALAQKPGVTDAGDYLEAYFLGETVRISKATGAITFPDGRNADFCEALTIYDWLCDRKPHARASGRYCPVSSLPGVLVSGSGLSISGGDLAAKIEQNTPEFLENCRCLGAKPIQIGDIGMEIMAFADLPVRLKFYHADEEFPPSVTILWDENILDFIRYETVYYLAACLFSRLSQNL